ncbi:MAG: hypothetical protein Q4C65_09835 [Eubacteriales bacterium]|nr:hypothetical protein [Eubacteriales bacterium]
MKSTDRKKLFREDADGKKQLNRESRRRLIVICAAAAAIAVILSGVGVGYSVRQASEENSLSFEEMENSVKGQVQEEMRSAAAYLEKLDESIAGNQKKLDEVSSRLSERQKSLLEEETSRKRLEENASGVTGKVTELEKTTQTKVNEIRTDMEAVHTDILTTLNRIDEMIRSMEEQEKKNTSEHTQSITEITRINEQVREVNETVEKLEERLTSSHDSLKTLLEQIKSGGEKNQKELVQNLTEVEGSLKQLLEADMAQVSKAFSDLTLDFQAKVDQLGSLLESRMNRVDQNLTGLTRQIGELDTGVSSSLTSLQQSFARQFGDLNVSAGQNTEELRALIGSLSEAMKQELNQVFTSVSNGKKELASALLTKGVTAKEDATFAQIRDAILKIDQKLVIGVQEIPGTISYQYHYHTNAAGETVHEEKSLSEGGCFTNVYRHYHSVGEGCYRTVSYHEHNDGCDGYPIWVDWDGEGYWGYIYTCGDPPNASRRELNCSRPEGAVEYYTPGCGLSDGQIIGAQIVYDREAVQTSAAALAEASAAKRALQLRTERDKLETEDAGIGTDGRIPHAPDGIAQEMERQRQEEQKKEQETVPESETEIGTGSEAEIETETGTGSEAEIDTETGTGPEAEIETGTGTEPETETETEPETKPEAATEAESEAATEPEAETEAEAGPETEPESGPEPAG